MTKWVSAAALCVAVSCTSSRSPPGGSSGTGTASPPTPAVAKAPGATVAGKRSAPTGVSASVKGFRWSGSVAAGKRVWLRNLNGAITVEGTTGSNVEVVASVRGRTQPSGVKIVVVPHDGTVTICAVWPAGRQTCAARGEYSHADVSETGTQVLLTVKLPRGVALDMSTVNGSLRANKIDAPVRARSINGGIRVVASGPADVASVNGRIDVTVKRGSLKASTTNGSIRAQLPKRFDAVLSARTVNGSINISVAGANVTHSSRLHSLATIGAGGSTKLELRTVNGSVSVVN